MQQGDVGPIDLDKKTMTLEPDQTSSGGLFVPGKERVVFKPSERKSLLGLDALAIAKRGGATVESGFKVPRQRLASVVSSLDEDEEASAASGNDELGRSTSNISRNNVQRRYRESYASETSISGSAVTNEREAAETAVRPHWNENTEEDRNGMMVDGSGKIPLVVIVVPEVLAGVMSLHHHQSFLVLHLILDLFPHGMGIILLILLELLLRGTVWLLLLLQ